MVLFYRGPDARITHEVFESKRPTHQSYAIRELEYVHKVREDVVDRITSSTPVRVCSTGMAGLSVVVAMTGWSVLDHPSLTLAALVLGGASSSMSAASWSIRARPLELRAVHRGRLVCLYQTTDRRTFAQVTRALLRVLEQRDDMR
jgi:hypothetical protein